MLTDRFGRIHDYLRISLTDACNLRCTYCMPEHPVFSHKEKLMSNEEIVRFAGIFVSLGVKKIRFTGGEPLVRQGAEEIISRIAELRPSGLQEMVITTNGIHVHNFIDTFRQSGIRSVNVSLDTLVPEKFTRIAKRDLFHQVLSNIHLLMQHRFHVKVNVVAMKGFNDDEINDFVELTRDFPLHVRFIEFMPFGGNRWNAGQLLTAKEMLETIGNKYATVPLNNDPHDTAKKFKVPGFEGTFAFISTMSQPFCGDCNRIRLTADGRIKNCLFSKGELDLLTPIRNGEDVKALILSSIQSKEKQWGGQPLFESSENRSMVTIGG